VEHFTTYRLFKVKDEESLMLTRQYYYHLLRKLVYSNYSRLTPTDKTAAGYVQ